MPLVRYERKTPVEHVLLRPDVYVGRAPATPAPIHPKVNELAQPLRATGSRRVQACVAARLLRVPARSRESVQLSEESDARALAEVFVVHCSEDSTAETSVRWIYDPARRVICKSEACCHACRHSVDGCSLTRMPSRVSQCTVARLRSGTRTPAGPLARAHARTRT